MSESNDVVSKPGYQGSERSSADLIIYPQKGDPILIPGTPEVKMFNTRGRDAKATRPSLQSVTTNKTMGAAAGTWTATLKPTQDPKVQNVLDSILDDDWVDIVFQRHDKKWHVMRGLVDEVRANTSVGSSGATVTSYSLSGRDFGSIFERTQVWFNPYNNEMGGAVSMKVFGGAINVYGNPSKTVRGFLIGFLAELANLKRAVWQIPDNVPSFGGLTFPESLSLDIKGFSNDPPRIAINANYMLPQGNIWQLAQEWSDPIFCELFCDTQLPKPPSKLDDEIPIDKTIFKVIFRDRPFPVVEPTISPNGPASPYFSLPLHIIPQQFVVASNLGRSGAERFNAFCVAPQIAQELTGAGAIDLVEPLWSTDDVLRHGLRRFDIQSHYVSDKAQLLTLSKQQRFRVRDWHCIDAYLLNGSLSLGRGFPQIHIGERVRVVGPGSPKTDKTFYVEEVGHSWNFGSSIKTNLGVTRGWVGDDTSYLNALNDLVTKYQPTARKQAGGPDSSGMA